MTEWQFAVVTAVVFFAGYALGGAQVSARWNQAEEDRSREQFGVSEIGAPSKQLDERGRRARP